MSGAPFLIFVVEDNDWYNRLIVHCLEMNPDFVVESFSTGADMMKQIGRNPALITLDFRLPDIHGDQLLKQIKNHNRDIEVVVISEQEDIETAVDLLRNGAFDYLVKEKNIQNKLLNTVNNIVRQHGLKRELVELKQEVRSKYDYTNIVGESKAIQRINEVISKTLDTDINVSISGETGTGKEVIAKTIHFNSKFSKGPFVAVNMAAIPTELAESELFGHEKGAFTGAVSRKKGKFEQANNGTLFLDEIGEMDTSLQAKILRVLQEREVVRVGGKETIPFNCRLITATNVNLLDKVKDGSFREDLYYRIKGVPIELPPLRNRGKDVILLAHYYIKKFCDGNSIPLKSISESASKKLLEYSWPGNVRELKSVIELAVVMSTENELTESDIMVDFTEGSPELMEQNLTLREFNQRIVEAYMNKYGNTKTVAEKLDIGQTTVYRLLKEKEDQSN